MSTKQRPIPTSPQSTVKARAAARRRRNIAIAVGAAVVIASLVVWRLVGGNQLKLSGPIECTTLELGFQALGRIVELNAQEGQLVKKGELLAALDLSEMRQREQTAKAQVESAEASLASARAQLSETRSGARPQEIEQSRQTLTAAQRRLENAKNELTRTRDLYNAGSQPKKALDAAETAYHLAEAEMRRAEQGYGLVRAGSRSEDIQIAESRVREAEAGVEQARQSLATAQTQLGYARLVAPVSGRVISKDAGMGEVVHPGTKILTIADLSDIWFRAYVRQAVVTRVKAGQTVEVTCDSLPGRVFQGSIEFVAFQSRTEQTKGISRVKVRVKNENEELKPGMTVRARIPLS